MASAKSDKAKPKTKTIIDVTHADSSPPSPNSKSVIVPSRPILKDPMVVEETEEKPEPIKVSREKQIGTTGKDPSIAELAAEAAAKSADKDDKAEKKANDKPAEEPDTKADDKPSGEKTIDPPAKEKAEDELENKPVEKPAPAEKPAEPVNEPDEPAEDQPDEAKTTDKEQAAKAEAEAKHDEAVAKLVESKQYYLPINTIEKRRSKRFVALGILLSLLLILAWGDIALDAQLIHVNGIKPVTHFFSN